jgi:uncharacterized protein YdeI (YjbR/CyaY-like superfamily)
MGKRDPRIDAYIAKSADFAKPIIEYVRDVVHEAVPDVEEAMKWSTPSFEYKGPLCGIAAFKEHCAFGFWKPELVVGKKPGRDRVTSVKDLPPRKEFVKLMKKAAKLNDEGVKVERKKSAPKPALPTPKDLAAALARNKKAKAAYDNFSPSHRREYVEWIIGAKSDETRQRRLTQAIEWMAEGKSRNWKYHGK